MRRFRKLGQKNVHDRKKKLRKVVFHEKLQKIQLLDQEKKIKTTFFFELNYDFIPMDITKVFLLTT